MKQLLEITDSKIYKLSESSLSGRKTIKIPIAILGEWSHPEYGQVKFTQQDFNDIHSNWKGVRAGYDPPLFLGHPIPTDTVEGSPSEGWPETIYQDGSTLYGEYSATDETLYDSIDKDKYRYASAEVLRGAKDKETGEDIGTLLVGVALTNRPFLPLKEERVKIVEKFSSSQEGSLTVFNFNLTDKETKMPDTLSNTVTNNEPAAVTSESTTTETPNTVVEPKQEVSPAAVVSAEKHAKLAEQFSTLAANYSELEASLKMLQDQALAASLKEKLAKLESLNLPAETKETFSDMITAGTLSEEAEAKLFSSYQTLSENYGQTFLAVQGEEEASNIPSNVEADVPQIYADIIAKNKQIVDARSNRYIV